MTDLNGGAFFNAEFGIGHRGNTVPERSGVALSFCGRLLKERDEVYAVARSTPARWLEKYYLVKCPPNSNIFAAEWTDEEKCTIQKWKWWALKEMQNENSAIFKPEWIPDLLSAVLNQRQHCA